MSRRTAGGPRPPLLVVGVLTLAAVLLSPRPAASYSILAHLGAIDALWRAEIAARLRERFGPMTPAQLREARAYAYGGALIQDLGYYPFGSHFFTDLTHYVRSGDFVQALIRDARDANEYAFALGALAHYTFDNAGHPIAVNRSVPLLYPKVRRKVGARALYVDDPARHLMAEFAFDVLQVAGGKYALEDYRQRIGFKVAKPLLERAFRETYALELADLFVNVDLAIGTYRHAVGTTLPDLTRLAWKHHREEIERATPGASEQSFVFMLTPRDYERQFGPTYRKPSFLARVLAFLARLLPKIGPLRPLAFEPLTVETERLFAESVQAAGGRYRAALEALGQGRLVLPNTDLDTGQPPARGVNRLADETYAKLLHELAGDHFLGASAALRRSLAAYFAQRSSDRAGGTDDIRRIRLDLLELNGG